MCGIAGFAGRGAVEDLDRMNQAQGHRGPDGCARWLDGQRPVGLAHTRLMILDPAGGAQPMWTSDGRLGITYNGEIYNHAQLRTELEQAGHRFQSDHSDTEVLLYGYRQWGRDLPRRLNGMWAFALYDREKGQIFLSRDRFGEKPLYYTLQDGLFAFASELRALTRHCGAQAQVCPLAVKKYFAYGFIPSPGSLYKRIRKLPGGCNLTVEVGDLTCRLERYWDFVLEPHDHPPPHAADVWGQELRHLLRQAVRRRLVADVPLGIFLSGGIDSSTVAAFAAEAGSSPQTFSIGFREPGFDESAWGRMAAGALGCRHQVQMLTLQDVLGAMEPVVAGLDEPLGDASIVPTAMLCAMARQHVTVALGGDGGDELLAGYDTFRALRWADLYSRLVPRPLHRAISALAGLLPVTHGYMSRGFRIQRALRGLARRQALWNPIWLGPLAPAELQECFDEPVDEEELYSEAIGEWDRTPGADLVDRTMCFYTRLYLQDNILTKVDRASMRSSLEVRSPFLDIDLVDFLRKVPHRFKLGRGQTKILLRQAMEGLLPKEILQRSKQGFALPVGPWFQEGALSLAAKGRALGQDADFIQRMAQAHRQGKADHRLFLWSQWALATQGAACE